MSTPGARFDELVRIMARLRAPDGCPWDRAQTIRSLRPFLLEETYEALEAIDRGDAAALCEELGDLLFEVVFLARIAEEEGTFTLEQAVDGVARKLVRRHPHVFGDAPRLDSPDQVVGRWEELKAAERGGAAKPKRLLDGVPMTLPALLRAYEYGNRAAAVGFDWTRAADVLDKIDEEVRELREAVGNAAPDPARVEEEMGDLLFAIANLSRKLGVEPEAALRRANDKFRARFTEIEARVAERGARLQDLSIEELEAEWQAVKNS
ncbi:MAG TPA: nucleoside triphosphate pyrophosphohydrolase [Vicinamibacterales bacterium]